MLCYVCCVVLNYDLPPPPPPKKSYDETLVLLLVDSSLPLPHSITSSALQTDDNVHFDSFLFRFFIAQETKLSFILNLYWWFSNSVKPELSCFQK